MLSKFIKQIFGKQQNAKTTDVSAALAEQARRSDPLESVARGRGQGWAVTDKPELKLRTPEDFPLYVPKPAQQYIGDSTGVKAVAPEPGTITIMDAKVGDDAAGCVRPEGFARESNYGVPEQLQSWYMSQSFIGYQACALISQHWLVDKACSQSGEDAVRHGWELKADGGDDVDDDDLSEINDEDIKMKVSQNLTEMHRFMNIFGIRVVLFEVESDDPDYYEKPFNIDGVTQGSYKGMSQVDPYWMMPMMTSESTNDPSSPHFYDPQYWVISGRRYHRSHLIIARGPQPADILKPTYIFGGISLTQRIYERVYAAERTANEAPLLALNKRTTAIHVDTDKAIANEAKFLEKLLFWVKYRDNHAVKVLGKEETMEQFDTSLADFDSVIMNQYQLVAAIAKTPATKLLGTSPKGFSSTGEFESVSYHEELESIQKNSMHPMLDRHYLLLMKSMGKDIGLTVVWNPVDSITTEKKADLNFKKADTGSKLITAGVISPDEERKRLKDDKDSGYNRLEDSDANTEPGMSPENLAAFEKAGAEKEKAEAAQGTAGARQVVAGAQAGKAGTPEQPAAAMGAKTPPTPSLPSPAQTASVPDEEPDEKALLKLLLTRLTTLEEHFIPEGGELSADEYNARTTKPSVIGMIKPSVRGVRDVVPSMDPSKLPKVKMGGMIVSIENPRDTIRKGESVDGPWQTTMAHHYGFVRGTKGADGDEIDCFIGPNPKSQRVFVINQNDNISGEFDEHKCMMGFDSPEDAEAGYRACYSPDWQGFGDMLELTMDQFKQWTTSENCASPINAACIAQTSSMPMTS